MQSKHLIFAGFLLISSLLFVLLTTTNTVSAHHSPHKNKCVAKECGSSEGTKKVLVYENVCDKNCPKVPFEWTKKVYKDCPYGYVVKDHSEDKCIKTSHPNKGNVIDRPTEYKKFFVKVQYELSEDGKKCVRPSEDTLRETYGMDREAREEFKEKSHRYMEVDVDCHKEKTYKEVECDDAEVIACAQECPTQCGFEGGQVPDGKGGYLTCEATAACPIPCEYNSQISSTDPMCVKPEEDEEEVLGEKTTVVVLADTAGGDSSSLLFIQSVFSLVLGGGLIYVGSKKYLL